MASFAATTKLLKRSFISPPPRTTPKTSLPLTFLDIPWLLFSPTQALFFYEFPSSTEHFKENVLPKLEHSLSLALKHFFPLAGKLVMADGVAVSGEPVIECREGDYVCVTVHEADSCGEDEELFNNLVGNHHCLARDFHGLVDSSLTRENGLQFSDTRHHEEEPLLSVNITIFPECGFSMGFTLRHVAADGRTFNNFLKAWAAYANGNKIIETYQTSHDRSIIKDPRGLKSIFLKDWSRSNERKKMNTNLAAFTCNDNDEVLQRATFVMGPTHMEKIKKWILTRSDPLFGSTHLLLSPYVLACAHIWLCWLKTHWPNYRSDLSDETVHYFGFIAGGFTRLHYPISKEYVGNFVAFGRAAITRDKLKGKNGILYAAKAIGDAIKKLNADALGGAEDWILEWEEIRGSDLHVAVTGSPKLGVYGLDFGMGRPVKIEELSIDGKREISLCEAKDLMGGIEVGVVLPRSKMDAFRGLFNEGLELLNGA